MVTFHIQAVGINLRVSSCCVHIQTLCRPAPWAVAGNAEKIFLKYLENKPSLLPK